MSLSTLTTTAAAASSPAATAKRCQLLGLNSFTLERFASVGYWLHIFLLAAVSAPGEPTNWANNIANIFLAPFGIGSSDSSVSAEGTKGDLLKQTQKRLPHGLPVHVACRTERYVCVRVCCVLYA